MKPITPRSARTTGFNFATRWSKNQTSNAMPIRRILMM